MLLTILSATLLSAAPLSAPAPAACIVMGMKVEGRGSPLDSLSFKVGSSDVKVCYGRPSAKGRTMIGGEAVPFGKLWRTGANEPTMIHTTGPLVIAGVAVPAGSYSLYTVPGAKSWQVIVNKSITQWGHEGRYTPEVKAQEVGTGTVNSEATTAPVEQFTITSAPGAGGATNLVLSWEKTKVSIPVTAGK
jgi:hypothetical protein